MERQVISHNCDGRRDMQTLLSSRLLRPDLWCGRRSVLQRHLLAVLVEVTTSSSSVTWSPGIAWCLTPTRQDRPTCHAHCRMDGRKGGPGGVPFDGPLAGGAFGSGGHRTEYRQTGERVNWQMNKGKKTISAEVGKKRVPGQRPASSVSGQQPANQLVSSQPHVVSKNFTSSVVWTGRTLTSAQLMNRMLHR